MPITRQEGRREVTLALHSRSPSDARPTQRYAIGAPTLTTIYVDPVHGNDAHTGRTRATALLHLGTAWRRVPQGRDLTTGVRLALMRGTYAVEDSPNYWESRHGTRAAPVELESVDGRGAARLPNMNVFDTRDLYLLGVNITSPNAWINHEAYDVKFVNNIVHDTEGAAFGVPGGYNILMPTTRRTASEAVHR